MTKTAIIDSITEGLGALVWWDLEGTRVTPDELRSILYGEGFDPSVVEDIDPVKAAKRAARDYHQGRVKDNQHKTETVRHGPNSVSIGILRRERIGPRRVRWVQVGTAIWRHSQWSTVTDDEQAEAHAQGFIEHAKIYQAYHDHTVIRPMIIQAQLAKMSACNLRKSGGVLYVPIQQMDNLERLARVVAQIGTSKLQICHVSATDSSREAIEDAAKKSLLAGLEEINERVSVWRANTKRKVRSDGAAVVIAQFAELKQAAELYSEALSVSLEDLTATMEEAQAEAMELINPEEE
jgi:hypothetical protein